MAETGLRERKLAQSRRAAEKAAVALCLEHGYDAVTVDMICERAGISARTFFNYFGAKEGAVLGDGKPMLDPAALDALAADDESSDVEAFVRALAGAFAMAEPDLQLVRDRHRLFHSEPYLAGLRFARIGDAREAYAEAALRRVKARRPELAPAEALEEAHLIVGVAMGAIQAIAQRIMTGADAHSLPDLVEDILPRLRRITTNSRPIGE